MELTIGTWRMTVKRIPPTPIELIQMYDDSADRWHRAIERLGYLYAYTDLFQRLQKKDAFSQLSTQAQILDVGIGSGGLSLSLAQNCSTHIHFNGVDVSGAMLCKSRQLLNRIGLNSTLTQRDVCALGFHDATFDLVMGAHVLEHLLNPLAAMHEMKRVLRQGAPLLLIVSYPNFWTTLLQLRWRYDAYTPAQIKQWMNLAGLSSVQIYSLQGWLPSRTSFACLGFKIE
jgi:ubiquinone/menaquinone biosynthesis C-methylase UbiE